MEWSLILLLVGFVVLVYLIFKFIKKLVFAVITVVLLVVLIFAGVGGIVYLDVNNLASQKDFDVNVVYYDRTSESYLTGVIIPVKEQSVSAEQISGITKSDLKSINVEEIGEDDNLFVIVVNDDMFESILSDEGYDLKNLQGIDFSAYSDYDLTLTKEEVIQIINSNDGLETFLDIVFSKNNVDSMIEELVRPVIKEQIENALMQNGLTFRQAVFMFVLSSSVEDESNVLKFVEGYKEGGVEVYPDRLTFKLVRWLPVDTVKSFIPAMDETTQ